MYCKFWKRLLDIVLSIIGLLVLFFPMLLIAALIKLDSPGPVFFRQERLGIRKERFTILKFRSMPVDVPTAVPTYEFEEVDRLTWFQRQMRRFSLDELPQLLCVLSSKMSLIGPRPCQWMEQELIDERDKVGAHDVKPGLTGLAQVNGRDVLTVETKAHYDGEYAQKLQAGGWGAFFMDAKIFFQTIPKLICGTDVVEGRIIEMDRELEEVVKQ